MRRERDIAAKVRKLFSEAATVGPEEIERRRAVAQRTLKARAEIGPIKTSTAELVRAVREGRVVRKRE